MKKPVSLILLALTIGVSGAFADAQHWSPPAGCANAGTWDLATTNWSTACDAGNNVTWTNGNDATFTIGGVTITVGSAVTVSNLTFGSGSGTLTVGGGSALTFTGSPIIDTTSRIAIFSAPYGGASSVVLTKVGTGTLSLNNNANTFAGIWRVLAGRLSFANDLALGPVPSSVITNYITLSNGVLRTTSAVNMGLNANRGIHLLGTGTWELSAAATNTINGKVTGGGALTLNGTVGGAGFGLSNPANDWTGNTTISSPGFLRLGASEVIPGGNTTTVTVNGILDMNGFNETVRSIAGSGSILIGTSTLTFNRTSGSQTFPGTLSGTGSLVKNGSYTQHLTGNNTSFSGKITIGAGVLGINGDTALGAVPGTVVTNYITFTGSTLLTSNAFTLNAKRGINLSGNGTWQVADTNQVVYGGIIAGTGGFTKSGLDTSTLVLNGTNTYTGTTTVSGGTLKLGNAQAISSAALAINGNTNKLDLNGFDIAVSGLSGSGTVTNSTGSPTVSITNGTLAAGASLTGSSVGLLTVNANLNLVGGTNRWELGTWKDDSDGTSGVDFDQISLTAGNLSLTNSALLVSFTSNAVAPDFTNTFWRSDHKWTVLKLNGGSNSNAFRFVTLVTNSFPTNSYYVGQFSTTNEPNGDISLSYTAGNDSGPILITQQVDTTVNSNANKTLSVGATGTATLLYQWYFNNALITDATNSSYAITNAISANQGNYYVEVSNGFGTTNSTNAFVTVIFAPTNAAISPSNPVVSVGDNVTFTATGSGGTQPYTYQWKSNTVNIAGATNTSLTLNNVQTNYAATYSVAVANSAGNVTPTSILTVNAASQNPVISALTITNNVATVSWSAIDTRTYQLQYNSDLGTSWTNIPPDVIAAGTNASATNNITGSSLRFYRVRLLP